MRCNEYILLVSPACFYSCRVVDAERDTVNSNPAPILDEKGMASYLREAIARRQPRGARKIARILCYCEANIWNMFTRGTISKETAEFLGYEKVYLYVRKDIMQDPDKMWMLLNGKGVK